MRQSGEDRGRRQHGDEELAGRRGNAGSIRPAAARLVERHGPALLATARRYAPSPEDAEDAYQRGLEILLSKAPDMPDDDLLPWMKTVVKHEAFAIWRSRDRTVAPPDEALERASSSEPPPDERVATYERLQVGAEAIARLKPQEVRCLLLRAEGFSYKQICEETGWTYTKVNRCITEGRRSFLDRVAGIESGSECDRMAPLLSALADGEATPRDLGVLRPHLRACSTCRATLREYRDIPRRTAALLPFAGVAAEDRADTAPGWVEGVIGWIQERAAVVAVKLQAAVEGTSAGKVAAVAASAAAIAGGTLAVGSLEEVVPARPPEELPGGGVLHRGLPADLRTGFEERAEPAAVVMPAVADRVAIADAGLASAGEVQAGDPVERTSVDTVSQERAHQVNSQPTTVETDPGNPVRGPRERRLMPLTEPVDDGTTRSDEDSTTAPADPVAGGDTGGTGTSPSEESTQAPSTPPPSESGGSAPSGG